MAQITADQIRQYLQRKGSPLASYANDFIAVGNKYGIDPRFLVAVSGAETGFAKAGSRLANPFGYMSAKRFSGPREVLELMARDLTRGKGGYYSGKNTIATIGATWAPPGAPNDAGGNSGWPRAVGQFYREMGGNPNAPVKGSGVATGVASGATSNGITGSTRSGMDYSQLLAMSRQQAQNIQSGAGYDQELASRLKDAILNSVANGGGTAGKVLGTTGSAAAPGYPLGKRGSIIGTPYSGTHTIGNWESDNAVDIAVPNGTPVYATGAGTIGSQFGSLGSNNPRMAGLRLHLNTGNNEYYYAHLSKFAPGIAPGVHVNAGQLLGFSGSANGTAHLHLGQRTGNPLAYFGK